MTVLAVRTFEMDTGWSDWEICPDLDSDEFSDQVARRYLESNRKDLVLGDEATADGYGLTKTYDGGKPGDAGVCMVRHSTGVILVEYAEID